MRASSLVSAAAGAAALVVSLGASPALALNAVSYVSGKGSDAGVCATPATACRTFSYALTQTKASGEIKALDPANYGATFGLVINKPITITGVPGAGIVMSSTDAAITVSAGQNAVVVLRHLDLNGQIYAANGITVLSARKIYIDDVAVRNFAGDGIGLFENNGVTYATVSNSVVTNNGYFGVRIAPSATLKATIDHVTSNDNGHSGFLVSSGATAAIVDCIADGNLVDGYRVEGNATSQMILGRSVATGNGAGVHNVSVGGSVRSYGDNKIYLNTTDTVGQIVTVPTK